MIETAQPSEPSLKPAPEVRRRSLPMQVIVVACGTLTVAALTVVSTRIYADRYGAQALSAVLLFRLYCSVLLAVSALGMPIALQRNIAFLRAQPSRAASAAVVGLLIGTLSVGAGAWLTTLFATAMAEFTRFPLAGALWISFAAWTFAQAVCNMVCCVHLARGEIFSSTILTVAGYGVSQIVALLLFPHATLSEVMGWTAALCGLCALPSLFKILLWIRRSHLANVSKEANQLLRYGLPRTIASVLEPLMDLTIPWLALASGAGLSAAGYLAVGLSLLRPLNPLTGALNTIMIPAAATLAASENRDAQGRQTRHISEWSLHLGMFGAVQLAVWCDVLIRLWLGPQFLPAASAARIICLSLLPVFVYGAMRGIIDGESHKPVNTWNLVISFGALLVFAFTFRLAHLGDLALAGAYLLSKCVLGALTLRYAMQHHSLTLSSLRLAPAFAFSLGLGALALLLRHFSPERMLAPGMAIFGALSFIVFIAVMARSGTPWARYLTGKVEALCA